VHTPQLSGQLVLQLQLPDARRVTDRERDRERKKEEYKYAEERDNERRDAMGETSDKKDKGE